MKNRDTGELSTEELLKRLQACSSKNLPGLVSSLAQERGLCGILGRLLEEKHLKEAQVVRAAGLNPTYGYQIFRGSRNPTREKLLPLLVAMGCSAHEANQALRLAGHSELYVRLRRDAVIYYGLEHSWTLARINSTLYGLGEETLSG